MPDREKVIRHFQDAITASGAGNRWRFVRVDMIEDAITLLREQEPVEPAPEHPVVINTLACGECHAQVARWDTVRGKRVYLFRAKYCPECGRKVKWDE